MTNDEAIKVLQDWIDIGFEYESGYGLEGLSDIEEEACKIAIMAIESQKVGKWTCTDDMDEWYGKLFRCSVCGAKVLEADRYCPYCGARMEGVEEDEKK